MWMRKELKRSVTAACLVIACASDAGAQTRATRSADEGDRVIAVGGDMIGPFKSIAEVHKPGFEEIRRILASSEATFANQEGAVFDAGDFKGWPAAENGGGTPLISRQVAQELRALGISMVSVANNHGTDWGTEGLLLTRQSLSDAGIVHSGSGLDATSARLPAYLDTARGRIGIVATASTFLQTSVPANAGIDAKKRQLRARPGISVLQTQSAIRADDAEIAAFKAFGARRGGNATTGDARIGNQNFALSNDLGVTYTINAKDRDEVLASVGEAAKSSLAIFTIHAHETDSAQGAGGSGDLPAGEYPVPGDFLPPLFHQAIDAGADMVVRHGPHVLNGIEIYKGRPIFYSLGSLFFDFGGARSYTLPGTKVALNFSDAWFESAVATVRYRGERAVEVRLYPAMIEVSKETSGGLPMRAHGADAQRILKRIQTMSAAYGTKIEIKDDTGIIRVPPER